MTYYESFKKNELILYQRAIEEGILTRFEVRIKILNNNHLTEKQKENLIRLLSLVNYNDVPFKIVTRDKNTGEKIR